MGLKHKFIEKQVFVGQTSSVTAGAATATNVEDFSKIGFQFVAVPSLNGRGTFSVSATMDGTNWKDVNTLIDNVVNSNSEQLTRVRTKALTSVSTSALVWIDNNVFKAVRIGVDIANTGDRVDVGSYSATLIATN